MAIFIFHSPTLYPCLSLLTITTPYNCSGHYPFDQRQDTLFFCYIPLLTRSFQAMASWRFLTFSGSFRRGSPAASNTSSHIRNRCLRAPTLAISFLVGVTTPLVKVLYHQKHFLICLSQFVARFPEVSWFPAVIFTAFVWLLFLLLFHYSSITHIFPLHLNLQCAFGK